MPSNLYANLRVVSAAPAVKGTESGSSPSHEKARLTLLIALLLLALSGIGASVAIIRLYLTERWVQHTYAVEVALGDLELALAGVGTSRIAYVGSPSAKALLRFQDSVDKVPLALARIRSLTLDNPEEAILCDRLEANAKRRVAASVQSVELSRQNQSSPAEEMQLTVQVAGAAIETAATEQAMRSNEDELLEQRSHLSRLLFATTVIMLFASFTLSAVMFWIHNRMLQRELHEREAAEQQLRKLSIQLLRVRDDEARRFARELHDGLGQTMVAAKMMAESLSSQNPSNSKFDELARIVQEAAAQTRTISYLLHPPMLDELGFRSAAEWFIEGFARRTGVAVATHIAPEVEHLPKDLELALFRILQEALTNIHRHSKSAQAEVFVSIKSQEITLLVKDYGRGIPPETLFNFKSKGTHVGVGLAGMKERVMEFKGDLEIQSSAAGTTITVKMPVTTRPDISVSSLA
jgi:signal transduction histidine kinase